MTHSDAPPVAAERLSGDCAEQAADAARAAALAERQRLARDLHDSVTQTLISLHLTAQAAAELWDTQPAQARAALETIRHLASGAATELRALLVDLHDAVLAPQGRVAALEAQCAVVRQYSGLHVESCTSMRTAPGRGRPVALCRCPRRTPRRSTMSRARRWPTWSSTPAPPVPPSR